MNRGDIWLINLGGRIGNRPVVVLTRQNMLDYLNKVKVAEITTRGKDIQQKYLSVKKLTCQSHPLFRPIIFILFPKINSKNSLELWIKIPCWKFHIKLFWLWSLKAAYTITTMIGIAEANKKAPCHSWRQTSRQIHPGTKLCLIATFEIGRDQP